MLALIAHRSTSLAQRFHELGQADPAATPQPFGGRDPLELVEPRTNLAVDDDAGMLGPVSYSARWLVSPVACYLIQPSRYMTAQFRVTSSRALEVCPPATSAFHAAAQTAGFVAPLA